MRLIPVKRNWKKTVIFSTFAAIFVLSLVNILISPSSVLSRSDEKVYIGTGNTVNLLAKRVVEVTGHRSADKTDAAVEKFPSVDDDVVKFFHFHEII